MTTRAPPGFASSRSPRPASLSASSPTPSSSTRRNRSLLATRNHTSTNSCPRPVTLRQAEIKVGRSLTPILPSYDHQCGETSTARTRVMPNNDPQSTLGSPYTDPRVQALLNAANDSARLFRTIFLSFLLVGLYFLVLALSADDELLFKDGDLRAPILNVSVQVSHYFIAAPWILMLLHINFLIQGVFLSRKLADYRQALPASQGTDSGKELLRLLFPIPWAQMASGVSSSGVPSWMLRAFVFFTLAILPLATLGVVQIQFLDFQSVSITIMHSGVLLLDLLFLWFLWHRMNYMSDQISPNWGWRRRMATSLRQSWLSYASPLLIVVFFLVVSFWRPSDVGDTEKVDILGDWLRSVHFLDVKNKRLYLGSDSIMPEDACEDPTLALNLSGRTYRSANLTESVLCNVVLADATLERAFLRGADLRGANLRNANLHGAVLAVSQMQGVDLTGARLYGALLPFSQLQGANLDGAYLVSVFMPSAQLQGASLIGTKLWRANLTGGAGLQGASLDGAEFHEANLSSANFQGAALTGGDQHSPITTVLGGGLTQEDVDTAADELVVADRGGIEDFKMVMSRHIGASRVPASHRDITTRGAVIYVDEDEQDTVVTEYALNMCGAFYPNLRLLQRVKSTNTLRSIPLETIRDWVQDGRCPEGLDVVLTDVREHPDATESR